VGGKFTLLEKKGGGECAMREARCLSRKTVNLLSRGERKGGLVEPGSLKTKGKHLHASLRTAKGRPDEGKEGGHSLYLGRCRIGRS